MKSKGPIGGLAVSLLACLQLCSCGRSSKDVAVIYCAQDQVYAEPILQEAGRKLGIEIRPLYDSEAVKTVGLANRLIAEKPRPRCDVFWGNEEMRTRQLANMDIFGTNNWAAFGYRSRRIVVNTNAVSAEQRPVTLFDLTNRIWRSKVALAYPLFGTTSTHFHGLRQKWGDKVWKAWCRDLAANEPMLVDGNSVVVKLVGQGHALVGLTDSDDIMAGQREGLPVEALPLTGESLLIPNTVAIVTGAPHAEAGRKLFMELQQPWVAERLVSAAALESSQCRVPHELTLAVDWAALLKDLESVTQVLKQTFLR